MRSGWLYDFGFCGIRRHIKYTECTMETHLLFQCPCHGACKEHPLLKHSQMSPAHRGSHPIQLQPNPPHRRPSARTNNGHIQKLQRVTSGKIQKQRSLFYWIVGPGAAHLARPAVVFYSCFRALWAYMS